MDTFPQTEYRPRRTIHVTPLMLMSVGVCVGIVVSHLYTLHTAEAVPVYCTGAAFVLAAVLGFWVRRTVFMVLCAAAVGAALDSAHWQAFADSSLPDDPTIYEGVVESLPQHRQRSTSACVRLARPYSGLVQLSVRPDSTLHKGARLLFQSQLHKVHPAVRPYFHYDTWLCHQGIGYRGFAHRHIVMPDSSARLDLRLVESLRSAPLSPEAEAVAEAMVLGNKSRLSPELQELYRTAGASHLLALSGLHLTIMAGLVLWLFGKSYRLRLARLLCITPLLWGYVYLTGAPPSLVRAATLLTIWMAAECASRHMAGTDTLALTVLAMVVVHPFYLFDTGFQLSVVAVAALTLYATAYGNPNTRWHIRGHVARYCIGTTVTSIVATVATAPLVVFTFHRLPLVGWLTSVVYIPITTVVIVGTMLLMALTWLSLPAAWVATVLDTLLGLQHRLMFMTDATWTGLYPSWFTVAMCYAVMVAAVFRRRIVLAFAAVTLVLGIVADHTAPEHSRVYFEHAHAKVVHGRETIHTLPCADTTFCRGGLYSYGGISILRVDDKRWRHARRPSPMPIDYLWVCRGFNGHICDLRRTVEPRQVVLDASLSNFYRTRFQTECDSLGLSYMAAQ